jgi:hypothetical protein
LTRITNQEPKENLNSSDDCWKWQTARLRAN